MSKWRSGSYRGHTQGPPQSSRCDEVDDPSSGDGSQALSQHVEDPLGQAQLPGHHHGGCDRRVDVPAADVTEALHHGGDAEAEAQGDEDEVSRGGLLLPRRPVDGGAHAQEDEDERGQVLSRHGPPEVLGPDAFKSHHYALTVTPGQKPPGKKNNEQND